MKKILCTLGPTSLNRGTIRRLEELGVDLFRINLSHTSLKQVGEFVQLARAHSRVPICLDTQGAQVRTGVVANGRIILKSDSRVRLVNAPETGDEGVIPLYPAGVLDQLAAGDLIGLDFDTALLQVVETTGGYRARVLSGGVIGSNKAASIDRSITLPPMTDFDCEAVRLGMELKIDGIALSFTNRRSDVELLRSIAGEGMPVISKIESRSALQNIDEILEVADAILIDRGDLSREVPIQVVPFVQKEIIRRANRRRVPVYVATNLLESMVVSAKPTRAEVNDVMNTLLDGADGLVLAAETAIGSHPVECVNLIRSLISEFERQWTTPLPLMQSAKATLTRSLSTDLVKRVVQIRESGRFAEIPKLEISETTLMDVRQIAVGTFSPIDGFMNKDTLDSVLSNYRLPNGTVWTMPIVLQLPGSLTAEFATGQTVALTNGGRVAALLHVEESFTYDLKSLSTKWFGTDNRAHPGVASLGSLSERFLAGKVDLIEDDWIASRSAFEFTPAQSRQIFEHRQWRKVVGFHTRNPAHRAHEYLQMRAMTDRDCDGILILPVFGPKKKGDFAGSIVMKSYELLLQHHEAPGRVLLGGLMTYSRYAGPREAIFTALCHKNFGCSHFIIGRDHTGVGQFYPADGAQRLIEKLGDIGIDPVFFTEVYYCEACGEHRESCDHGKDSLRKISGTNVRESLAQGRMPPLWHMREPIARFILNELEKGNEVFVQ